MMSIQTLLETLRALDAKLWVEDGRIRCSAPRGALTPELRAQLSDRRDEILAALAAEAGAAARDAAIARVPRGGPLPTSFGQQRLWFITRMAPDAALYHLPLAFRVAGQIDTQALRRALAEIVSRHEVLRTTLTVAGGEPVQVVRPEFEPCAAVEEIHGDTPEERETALQALLASEARHPFDLEHGPVFRARIIRMGDADHVVTLSVHHIAADGWSLGVLQRDLVALYRAFAAGEPSPLAPLPIQYADFAAWQRGILTRDVIERELSYWRERLAGLDQALELPTDRPRPAVQTTNGSVAGRALPPDVWRQLRAVSGSRRVTLFMAALSAWAIVLSRFSGRTDIAIGSPVANRGRRDLEDLVGFFVNSLVLRVDLDGDPTFGQLLDQVRATTLSAHAHQQLPFEKLVEEIRPSRDLSRHPLFQVEFVLHADRGAAPQTFAGLAARPAMTAAGGDGRPTPLDLSLEVTDDDERPAAVLAYNRDLFDASTIHRLLDDFELVLTAVASNPQLRPSQVPALLEADRERLAAWNATGREYPSESCVHELVEQQAARTPAAVAVVSGAERLGYSRLDRRAVRIADRLRQAGVGPGARVGVYMERSVELVCALLGVLKTGAAYVPLDPAFPADRIEYMLRDSQAAALIVDRVSGGLPAFQGPVLPIADLESGEEPPAVPSARVSSESAAYVIYTSGSTGRPKGVQVPHRTVVNFLASMRDEPGLSAADRLLAVTTLSFDIAGLELFLPLTTGATVVLAGRTEASDPRRLMALMERSGATVMQATPATWRMLIDAGWRGSASLRILCGGEAMPDDLAGALCDRGAGVWNLYGPTETTIWSTCERVVGGRTVTIGRPIANTRVHLLGPALQPVPIGAIGEIFIGGDGVAAGYLNRPELTAERFLPDAWSAAPGARMYRTGDLGRYLADGRLQCLGRVDHQVKLRGFRIELGEIESLLAAHPHVSRVVARVREDVPGDARLVAYVVPVRDQAPDTQALIEQLEDIVSGKLPQYMHPSAYVALDALPLTPNGKIDRAALPAPERPASTLAKVAPRTDLEERIAAIWKDVLRLEAIGVEDNFFDLGGHSLLLVQVQTKLSAGLDRNIEILELFQYPTVAALAHHLGGGKAVRTFSADAADRAGAPAARGRDSAIAIVGMAGRFPGAADIERFWQNLRGGVEGIRFFTDEELKAAGVPDHVLQLPNYVKARGALDGADLFDAGLFRFTPREADLMDPQQRVFLECAWEALERAAYDPNQYDGLIGVFAGSSFSAYLMTALATGAGGMSAGDVEVLLNGDKDYLPTRVSYKLNLRGPSVTVQTACSTSLVAVHLACRSLLARECDMALAGGVSVGMTQVGGYMHVEGSIASPDGHCRTFDARAQGTVGGNGVGIVVLKRLADALADGDHIHAVLLGTAINNDGSGKVGFTAPSVEGEARAIALAQAAAGCAGDSISYVEAHGTATILGDPIEVKALTQVFREATDARGYCAVGSLKSSVGHLDAAAGIGGLIKTALALEHRELPPTLNFESPNPEIDFAGSPFYVNTQLRPWPEGRTPRRAGVSSFGLGGTNAHAVLEEAPAAPPSGPSREWQVLAYSARTEGALETLTDRLAGYFVSNPDANLADVAFTLAVGRQELEHRRIVVCRDAAEAVDALTTRSNARMSTARFRRASRVAFLFPGQGAQHAGMGADLYESEALFRHEIDGCAEAFLPLIGFDIRDALYRSGEPSAAASLQGTLATQAALFATEYALAKLWMSWGVMPAAMIGHSIGEYVAAALSGVLTREEAIALVATRAQLMERAPAGAMLAVSLDAERAGTLLGDGVSLAAVNGPIQCVLSGTRAALEPVCARLIAEGVDARWLQTAGAFHSALMDPVLPPLTEAARRVRPSAPSIPYVSNVTGDWIMHADVLDPGYWARHVRGTVDFHSGTQKLIDAGIDLCLEVGPGQTLGSLVRQTCAHQEHSVTVLTSLPRAQAGQNGCEHVARTLGRFWLLGVRPDWKGYYAHEERRRVVLPTYPFERKRHWLDTAPGAKPVPALTAERHADLADWFYTPEWQSHPTPRFDPAAVRAAGPWLVFADTAGLGRAIAAELQASGAGAVLVEPGEAFARAGEGYQVAPGRPEHFAALLSDLQQTGRVPRAMVHAWAYAADVPPDALIDRAFNSLVQLVRAAGEVGIEVPRTIGVITSGVHRVLGDETLTPGAATALGPALVFPAEHEGVRCRAIDLVAAEWTSDAPPVRPLLAMLFEEAAPVVVARRRGRTWSRTFHRQRLDAYAGPHRFKPRGVYLITGGYGGIGLELATYLAETCSARLILTGREGLPDRSTWPAHRAEGADPRLKRRIEAIESLEARGADVLAVAADVADEDAMRRVVGLALEKFGAIDGAVHAAGIAGARVMQMDDGRESRAVLSPKVTGTEVLFRVLEQTRPEFIVLCSSIGTLVGGMGQSAYTAANAYLDAVAHAAPESGPEVLAINWDAWQEVGMAVDTILPERLARARREELKHGIRSSEGREAFVRLLHHGTGPQVIVSTRDVRPKLAARVETAVVEAAPESQASHDRPELAQPFVAPRNPIEEEVAAVWRRLFGIANVGVDDDFFELGGHSLLATQVMSRLREQFPVSLPLSALFDAPTVAGLSMVIMEKLLEAEQAPIPRA